MYHLSRHLRCYLSMTNYIFHDTNVLFFCSYCHLDRSKKKKERKKERKKEKKKEGKKERKKKKTDERFDVH